MSREDLSATLAGMATPVALERTLDGTLGLRHEKVGPDLMVATLALDERHADRDGLVHGGVFAAIAESLASMGTMFGILDPAGGRPSASGSGMSNDTTVVTPVHIAADGSSSLRAVACRRFTGPGEVLWDVEITDGTGTICSISKMVIAVRPLSAAPKTPPGPG